MNATPKALATGLWNRLRRTPTLTARARGFLGDELILSTGGEEVGRLELRGLRGATFTAGELETIVERTADAGYRMFAAGEEVLTAHPTSGGGLEIACGGRTYTATISLLRNTAVVRDPAGGEAARVSGGLAGRSYTVETDPDDACAPPVALLALYHTASRRRRAYQAAGGR